MLCSRYLFLREGWGIQASITSVPCTFWTKWEVRCPSSPGQLAIQPWPLTNPGAVPGMVGANNASWGTSPTRVNMLRKFPGLTSQIDLISPHRGWAYAEGVTEIWFHSCFLTDIRSWEKVQIVHIAILFIHLFLIKSCTQLTSHLIGPSPWEGRTYGQCWAGSDFCSPPFPLDVENSGHYSWKEDEGLYR